jgi:hypothetical protein
MRTRTIRIAALSAVASLALAGGASAKNGADDPAGHVRHGADDGVVHVRNGADDPANHDARDDRVKKDTKKARHHRHHGRHHRHAGRHAKHGADDGAGHVRHGGGRDDLRPHS